MKEDETIHEFHMNILEIANTSGALGEKMTDEKLVRKILRSLPKRFAMKVTAIEEAQDISNLKLDELIGSLQTFEMGFDDNSEKKSKVIALVSNTESEAEDGTDENMSETIAMLGKQLKKILKEMKQGSSRRSKTEDKNNKIKCHECEGYGHLRAECPTYLKKQKGYSVTWSDGDSDSDSEKVDAKHAIAFTGVCDSDDDSSEGEVTYDVLASTYRELCVKSAEIYQQGEKQKKLIIKMEAEIKEHLETIDKLKCEVSMLSSKIDQMSKSIKMLNCGTEVLEEILLIGKNAGDTTGIGFGKQSYSNVSQQKN